ncbi:MAG: hypothetical protein JNJ90_14880 [Saprospiraceae bacterium]|jgi:hypothetical protein|nr:hypothetical protein [Saprospiraceae bacterium]
MKKTHFTALFVLVCFGTAICQKEETLAGSSRVKGGFGSPFFTFSQASGQNGVGAGVGGAFIVNDFFIGASAQGESFGIRRYNGRDYNLTLTHGGFWLGYAYPSYKLVHLFTSMKIGWGNVALSQPNRDPFDPNSIRDNVFVLSPEIGTEVNLLHWFRLCLTVGYRSVSGVSTLPTVNRSDFNGATFGITMRFGGFGYNK